ncbi:MAG: NAD-glutamate dehydrogenase, partial [Pseudomonadota bacterium]
MLEEIAEQKDGKLSLLADEMRSSGADVAFATFAAILFRHADAEDLARYTVTDLHRLARAAWSSLQKRDPGTPRIEVMAPEQVAVTEEDSGKAISVVEALNDDKPFLFGSLKNELHDQSIDVHLIVHPIFAVERDDQGHLISFHGEARHGDGFAHESFVHVHVAAIDDAHHREALTRTLLAVHNDVDAAVGDWPAMRRVLEQATADLRNTPPPGPHEESAEGVAFLEMLEKGSFILTGMREYRLDGSVDDGELVAESAGLGILRDPAIKVLRRGRELVTLNPEIRAFLKRPEPVYISKANVKSKVHRHVHLDYVGVKRFQDGVLVGELRIVGLFTSEAYTESVLTIPILRRKINGVINTLGFDPDSHSGNAVVNILETYPRDEIFQIEAGLLARFAQAILHLSERPRVRVLSRIDPFDRFVSLLIYLPRDRYTTAVADQIEQMMAEVYEGHVSASTMFAPEGVLNRIHLIIGRRSGVTPSPSVATLEDRIARLLQTWSDELLRAATEAPKLGLDRKKISAWSDAFSDSYRATYSAERAVRDITILERITEETPTAILFFRREGDGPARCSLKIYHRSAPILLSSRVPILENMGFLVVNERTFRVDAPADLESIYLHDMTLELQSGSTLDVPACAEKLQSLFIAVWEGAAESDEFNGLLMAAGLGWRDIAILRALSRYLRQTGIAYGQDLMAETLIRYPDVARALIDLFAARFDPDRHGEDRQSAQREIDWGLEELCRDVETLADDTIIHRFKNLIDASLRTNLYQVDENGEPAETFAFKLDPHKVIGLPRPAPYREIWVYSPRVEGVHLRFGPVARGGLRWSDRPQDFRTEILGLVKAQQVKNAVIVPVGAKGGFFPKKLPDRSKREAFFEEGQSAYKIFIRSLLSITDNREGGTIKAPDRVVRHDGDDPYLVVAADKGTATFSDTANAISEEDGFWLDDAFASGGSAGYDHKVMGITARGAWEAVKRHFREMDHDIQNEPFSVVGVGDMSGDVFGNGMLLSRHTKLIAAFDHRDIFIDPDPDAAASYAARETLFAMPRSSWQDYDRSALSAGGGIFSRTAKSITLSPEARAALEVGPGPLTPQDLMKAILKAPADLLWFGGIGTYVRGPLESNQDIGDRANDPIRIEASEVRVKVVGEGANLGVSHKGRIAYALQGGRINSDAIDNSAGVNTSDVEVNIKIALAEAMRSGKLTREARNALLEKMTDEVAEVVLRNNYLQTLAISLSKRQNTESVGLHKRLMDVLEPRGLDREIEDLPSDEALDERAAGGEGLTRPEIGVLLAYAKLTLFDDIMDSDVPDDAYLGRELARYFPHEMNEGFHTEVQDHRLRREIIATMLANSMINRGGPTFIIRVGDQTGASTSEITRAFAAARDAYQLLDIYAEIDALDTKIPGDLQLELYAANRALLQEATVWFIRNESFQKGLQSVVDRFRAGLETLRDNSFAVLLTEEEREAVMSRMERLKSAGVPDDTALRLSRIPLAIAALDIVTVADHCEVPLFEAADVWFAVDHRFRFSALDDLARRINVADYYDGLALDRARRSLADAHNSLAITVLKGTSPAGGSGTERLTTWLSSREALIARAQRAVTDIVESGAVSISRVA